MSEKPSATENDASSTASKAGSAALQSVGVPAPIAKKAGGKLGEMGVKHVKRQFKVAVATLLTLSLALGACLGVLGGGDGVPDVERQSSLAASKAEMDPWIVSTSREAGTAFRVPWEIIAAIAFVQTGGGLRVPGDPQPERLVYPSVAPPISVQRGDASYEGVFLLDSSTAGVDGNQTGASARFIASHLRQTFDNAPEDTAPDDSPYDSAAYNPWDDKEFWIGAISSLPIASSNFTPLPPVAISERSCTNEPAVHVIADAVYAAGLNFNGKPDGVNLRTLPVFTFEQAATATEQLVNHPRWVDNPERRSVTVAVGSFDSADQPTIEGAIDRMVAAVGAADLTLVRPRDAGDAAYPNAVSPTLTTNPYPVVSAAFDAAVARHPEVTVINFSDWEQTSSVHEHEGEDAGLYTGAVPVYAVLGIVNEWVMSTLCPTVSSTVEAPAPTEVNGSTRMAEQVWQVAWSWQQGLEACGSGSAINGPLTGASSKFLDQATLTNVLATIGELESGNNYTESSKAVSKVGRNGSSNPTGRYQWLYDSWGKYGGYDEAYLAPPEVQDAYTALRIDEYLEALGDGGQPADISWIPVAHYAGVKGALELKSGVRSWSTIPNPRWNKISYGGYRDKWMDTYQQYASGEKSAPPVAAGASGISILGPATITADQMIDVWNELGKPQANLTIPVDEFIRIVYDEAEAEGVRPDFVMAQMFAETGWFTNSDTKINNFAGIAHYDNVSSGKAFDSPRLGARAQVQVLHEIVVGRKQVQFAREWAGVHWGVDRKTDVWNKLGGVTAGGVGWATAPNYWDLLLSVYTKLAETAGTAIPEGANAAGLIVCSSAAGGSTPLVGPYCTGIRGSLVTFNGLSGPSLNQTHFVRTPNVTSGMQPAAAAAWDELVAAAVQAGFPASDFKGDGYGARPNTPSSAHPVGLAIDIYAPWVQTGGTYPAPDGVGDPVSNAFRTPQFKWLWENAWKFGFCTPRYQRPNYLAGVPESRGTYVSGARAPFEHWHWEYAAGVTAEQTNQAPAGDLFNGPFGGPLNGPVPPLLEP